MSGRPRRKLIGTLVCAAYLMMPGLAYAGCGGFYCWTEDDLFEDDEFAHSGDPGSVPPWGSDPVGSPDWGIVHGHTGNNFASGGYENWHDYASPDWLEMTEHNHPNCGGGGET